MRNKCNQLTIWLLSLDNLGTPWHRSIRLWISSILNMKSVKSFVDKYLGSMKYCKLLLTKMCFTLWAHLSITSGTVEFQHGAPDYHCQSFHNMWSTGLQSISDAVREQGGDRGCRAQSAADSGRTRWMDAALLQVPHRTRCSSNCGEMLYETREE